jgi:hypothetical protein
MSNSKFPEKGTRAVKKGTPVGKGPVVEVYDTEPVPQPPSGLPPGESHGKVCIEFADHKVNHKEGYWTGEGRKAIPVEEFNADYNRLLLQSHS